MDSRVDPSRTRHLDETGAANQEEPSEFATLLSNLHTVNGYSKILRLSGCGASGVAGVARVIVRAGRMGDDTGVRIGAREPRVVVFYNFI
ncbi:hypothetical protein Tco_0670510 [Tanacetum coccineum]